MIAKGVRFNAEKKQVGNYYSTKVLENLFYCLPASMCHHHIKVNKRKNLLLLSFPFNGF